MQVQTSGAPHGRRVLPIATALLALLRVPCVRAAAKLTPKVSISAGPTRATVGETRNSLHIRPQGHPGPSRRLRCLSGLPRQQESTGGESSGSRQKSSDSSRWGTALNWCSSTHRGYARSLPKWKRGLNMKPRKRGRLFTVTESNEQTLVKALKVCGEDRSRLPHLSNTTPIGRRESRSR